MKLQFKSRKLQKSGTGSSFFICVPHEWMAYAGIRAGDPVKIIVSGKRLILEPEVPDAGANPITTAA